MPYADVAVDSPAPQQTYTFALPDRIDVRPGQAVWVPFGRGSQLTQGIVFALTDVAPDFPLKPVAAVIETQPLLSAHHLDLARWMAGHYFAPLFDCAALFMPPGFRQRVRTAVALTPPRPGDDRGLDLRDRQLLEYVGLTQGPRDLRDIAGQFGARIEARVRRLVRSGHLIQIAQFERPRTGPRFVRRIALTEAGRREPLDSAQWARRFRQRAVLTTLRAAPDGIALAELREQAGTVSAAMVESLEQSGLVRLWEERVVRDPLTGRSFQESFPLTLTPPQGEAVRQVTASLDRPGEQPHQFLLHGVTGSGKTEVYLQALQACVARGRRGIVLIPEIALEPQTVARFAARFPGRVAVLHSGLTPGEAYDEWWRIREGAFDVVIGPRSALFAPQPDLGLVVIDEEHEPTYKQEDPPPRYEARRVAARLCTGAGATLVLGSATPGIDSYLAALQHRLVRLELPDRAAGPGAREGRDQRGLPAVQVVDLREELRGGNRSLFSRPLQSALMATLQHGQQAILFLNRRGSATFIQCRDCGAVVRCRRCEAPLTYHSAQERLQCHQCNHRTAVPTRCRECGSGRIKFLGAGTQRVASEVERLLPAARVLRWDRDTTGARGAHEELLRRFAAGEADVLVGTQMVAKGLDLPAVTLVGVVNADVNLYLPDFRSAERSFQLLTQVAGRAGRGVHPGRVVIQTYTPEHYAIAAAAHQDYEQFAHHELAFRRRLGYPPFEPLIRLLYADVDVRRARAEAEEYARRLTAARVSEGASGVKVLGPTPGFFRRVRGRYRWQVLLRGPGAHELLQRHPPPRAWVVDVDPLHVL